MWYHHKYMNDRTTTYLTIMTKNSIFSFLGLVRAEMVDSDNRTRTITAVVKHDPRESQPMLKEFNTRSDAVRSFEEAVDLSIGRGWSVVYRGKPMYG